MLVAECGLLVPYAINERTDATEAEVFFCCMFTINANVSLVRPLNF